MQIFKRLKKQGKPAQNLVEIAFIIPILMFLTLVMLEVGLFWQDLNAIYTLNAEINANIAGLKYTGLKIGDICPAVDKKYTNSALSILEKKGSRISLNTPNYAPLSIAKVTVKDAAGNETEIDQGKAPFVMYKYYSTPPLATGKPQISLWVDCRNPFENGVTTQIEFYHKTLIMKAQLPRYDSSDPNKKIIIIPEHWFIASPKLNTLRQY